MGESEQGGLGKGESEMEAWREKAGFPTDHECVKLAQAIIVPGKLDYSIDLHAKQSRQSSFVSRELMLLKRVVRLSWLIISKGVSGVRRMISVASGILRPRDPTDGP